MCWYYFVIWKNLLKNLLRRPLPISGACSIRPRQLLHDPGPSMITHGRSTENRSSTSSYPVLKGKIFTGRTVKERSKQTYFSRCQAAVPDLQGGQAP
ncbi:hypothetical protein NPIL_535441 [Nephila pilipes]|uniref:Uncharacterized protein n=1 Tax=Nephila pilipes TaxID=299642 RepID=A0A8X6U0H5_NEPPI|nr:hypothetical protein NPIL_535441 [Nephila pilipes]